MTEFPIALSIGVLAWNEEETIGPMLASLVRQSIFAEWADAGRGCEIICVCNGCTDRTAAIAGAIFADLARPPLAGRSLRGRVVELPVPGRNQAWNTFVHELSAGTSRYLCLMDADILFDRPDTLARVLAELEGNPRLGGASDTPLKQIADPARPSWRERLSLATSEMTGTIPGRLNGMLYCLRAAIARNLYLPRDLGANDDGFFKAVICTDFFRAPLDPGRVVSVRGATHRYAPYLSAREVLNNQKRQMIGQTTVHVVVEYLKTLPSRDRGELGATLRRHEAEDPDWLKRLIAAHLRHTRYFWRLFPGLLGFRWRRLAQLPASRRVTHLPAAGLGFAITLIACWRASRFLRGGRVAYWPKAGRRALGAEETPP